MTSSYSNTIVIAIDEGKESQRALEFYAEHLHKPEHNVVIAHAVEIPAVLTWTQPGIVGELLNEAQKEGEEMEEDVQDRLRRQGISSRVVKPEVSSSAGDFIVSTAVREGAGLVVLGTRGQGALSRAVLGSVSDHVLHNAPCAVVIHRQ